MKDFYSKTIFIFKFLTIPINCQSFVTIAPFVLKAMKKWITSTLIQNIYTNKDIRDNSMGWILTKFIVIEFFNVL